MTMMERLKAERAFDALGLGEVMLRLSPVNHERIGQGDVFEKRAGGSELNVVSGVSLLGLRTGVITKLPHNEIGSFIKNRIRFCGVSDDYLIYDAERGARLGIYYYEGGAYPRKSSVVYDRAGSAFTTLELSELPESMYASTRLFHTSGITLALTAHTCATGVEMIKRFHDAGAVISFDCNYRANLWDEDRAREVIQGILPMVDILFVSEETSRRMMARTGTMEEIMRGYCEQFGISVVASTARTIISPRKHTFTSTIYSAEQDAFFTEEPYRNIEVIDRIGSGDAYVAGVLYGLLSAGDFERALRYGNAMSAIKNTVPGDLPDSSPGEIERIIRDHQTGSQSEMNR